jgi:hypothetical protein
MRSHTFNAGGKDEAKISGNRKWNGGYSLC